jgi:ADP-heptose:LPS heptosyltransferase
MRIVNMSTSMPRSILLRNKLCPGDVVLETGVVRDLHRAYPGQFHTGVEDRYPQIWRHNPLIDRKVHKGNAEVIELGWTAEDSDNRPRHLLDIWADDLAGKLGIQRFPTMNYRGDIYLGPEDLERPTKLVGEGKYWVVMANRSYCQTKQWPISHFQEVIDTLAGSIRFVQCGAADHDHGKHTLAGAHSLLGRTNIRQLIRAIHHAEGVLCPITFAMHLAAAIPPRPEAPQLRPCVVLAGGREPVHVFSYPGQQVCHRSGALPCNAGGSCWRNDVNLSSPGHAANCHQPVKRDGRAYAKCQDLIQPAEVCRAIWSYYEAGALEL